MNINLQNLKPADRIVVPKSNLRVVQHHAIYLGKDRLGNDLIAENAIGKGVQIVYAKDFFRDVLEITEIIPFVGNERERNEAVHMAINLQGQNYDLFSFNCEHYANVIQKKVRFSQQANNGIGLGLLGLFLLLIVND